MFRCIIQWRFRFCFQTHPEITIWVSYGRSKTNPIGAPTKVPLYGSGMTIKAIEIDFFPVLDIVFLYRIQWRFWFCYRMHREIIIRSRYGRSKTEEGVLTLVSRNRLRHRRKMNVNQQVKMYASQNIHFQKWNVWHLSNVHLNPFLLTAPVFLAKQIRSLACHSRSHCSPPTCSCSMKLQWIVDNVLTHHSEVPHCCREGGPSMLGYIFPQVGRRPITGGFLAEAPLWPPKLRDKWQNVIKFIQRASRRQHFGASWEPAGSTGHSLMLMMPSRIFPCGFLSRALSK